MNITLSLGSQYCTFVNLHLEVMVLKCEKKKKKIFVGKIQHKVLGLAYGTHHYRIQIHPLGCPIPKDNHLSITARRISRNESSIESLISVEI